MSFISELNIRQPWLSKFASVLIEHWYFVSIIFQNCFPTSNICFSYARRFLSFWWLVWFTGEWTFYHVHLDLKHWLVEEPSPYQPWCCCCNCRSVHNLNLWFYLYQQVYLLCLKRPYCYASSGFKNRCLEVCYLWLSSRLKPLESLRKRTKRSSRLILTVAIVYCLWCTIQVYVVRPPRPAVGEEADLGVLVFLGIYFFLPYWLCIFSMNPKEFQDSTEQLPL